MCKLGVRLPGSRYRANIVDVLVAVDIEAVGALDLVEHDGLACGRRRECVREMPCPRVSKQAKTP